MRQVGFRGPGIGEMLFGVAQRRDGAPLGGSGGLSRVASGGR